MNIIKAIKLLLVAALLTPAIAKAQTLVDNYRFSTGVDTSAWIDITGQASALLTPPSGGYTLNGYGSNSSLTNIGFSFQFADALYTQFSVNKNGMVRFGQTAPNSWQSSAQSQGPLNMAGNMPFVNPFGYNGTFDSACYSIYAITGTPGNRVLVIEMKLKVVNYYATNSIICQVQLFEANDEVRIVHGPTPGTEHGGSQPGLANTTSDIIFIDFSTNTIQRRDGATGLSNAAGVWPEQGRYYSFVPDWNACPFPSEISLLNENPDSITLAWSGVPGSTARHLTIVPAGIDTIVNDTTFTFHGQAATAYSCTMQTLCGSDTSIRRRTFNFQTDCGAVNSLPWSDDFNLSNTCWQILPTNWLMIYKWYWMNTTSDTVNGYMISNYSSSPYGVYNGWLISPPVALPYSLGLTLNFLYKSEQLNTNNPKVRVRVSVCDTTDEVDTTTMWTILDTIDNYAENYEPHSLSLDAFAGHRVRVAFQRFGYGGAYAYVDNVGFAIQGQPDTIMPHVSLIAANPSHIYYYGDTATFTANLWWGSTAGLSFTWHSTLLDSTWVTAGPTAQCHLVYGLMGGIDTVTVTATNIYGSNTATVIVNSQIITTPSATLTVYHLSDNPITIGDTVTYTISRNNCVTTGLTYSLHSSLNDTTITLATTVTTCIIPLVYTAGGIDTVTATLSNIYSADTAVAIVQVINCDSIMVPFFEDLENVTPTVWDTAGELPFCWNNSWSGSNTAYSPHVITTGGCTSFSNIPNNALFMVASNSTGFSNQAEIILPHFAVPLQTLAIAFDYRCGSANNGTLSVGYYDTNNVFTTVETLPNHTGNYLRDTVSLTTANTPNALIVLRWSHNGSYTCVAIDNIAVFTDSATLFYPQVSLLAPNVVHLPDSATFTVSHNNCSSNGLQFFCHSSLLDTTFNLTSDTFHLTYPFSGVDTVSVIFSNIYGADTATAIVNVIDCYALQTAHFFENFNNVIPTTWTAAGELPPCWTAYSNGSNANYAPHVITTNGYSYLNNIPDNALLMVAGGVTYGSISEVILPRFAYPTYSLSIAFDYQCENSTQGTLEVGYYDASNNFTSVDTIINHTGNYLRDTVSFASVNNPTAQIVLRWTHSSSFWAVVIDNIEVFVDSTLIPPMPDTVWRTVTVLCDSTMGSVSGGGTYPDSSLVTISATANDGHHFTQWDDGDTNAVRIILLTSDTSFTAYFEADPHDTVWRNVTVLCDSTMGSVSGDGTYPDSSLVTIAVTANDGYHFTQWDDGDTNAVRSILLTSDTSFTAYFEANPPDTVWYNVNVVRELNGMIDTVPDGYITGDGSYPEGDTVTLTMLCPDYKCWPTFYGWVLAPGDTVYSDVCQFVITCDTVITAYYVDVVGIAEVETEKLKVEIYPNPTHGDVTIAVTNALTHSHINEFTVSVVDLMGRTVIPPTAINSSLLIPHSTLPSGTFFVRVTSTTGTAVRKLIVE